MIFVTVGTHEQQFNRLIEAIDKLKGSGTIQEEVVMQTGFCTYEPRYCENYKLMSYQNMNDNIQNARIIITHGGPASFIAPLQVGKIPIVVPRQKQYGEHINNHQMEFCTEIEKRMGNIIVIKDVSEITEAITQYERYCKKKNMEMMEHNKIFNMKLSNIVSQLMNL